MKEFILALPTIVSIIVFLSAVLSVYSNLHKADKTDVKTLNLQMEAVRKNFLTQQAINSRLQQQIDEKNNQIAALQLQNSIEEEILENRDPQLEQVLATLAAGQSAILELLTEVLKGGKNA